MMDPIIESDLEVLQSQPESEEFRSLRCLVTGGAGFLGSWLCDILVRSGAIVDCVDDLSTGLLVYVNHLRKNRRFTFRRVDVTAFNPRGRRYDLVFHFASRASPEEYQQHPIETLAANSHGTHRMLELAGRTGATLLYASSSEVYGDAELVPTPETYWGKVNPIGPRSCYDEGKRFGEALCKAFHRTYDLDVRIVRLFNTFGPRQRPDGVYARVLSRFIDQALSHRAITVQGDGHQTRSFCYVSDLMYGILLAAKANQMAGEVVNIGNPEEIQILELAQKIKDLTRGSSKITYEPARPDDPRRRCPDILKAKTLLGWSPRVDLESGLEKTVEWFAQSSASRFS